MTHHLRTVFTHILGIWEGNLHLGRDLPALEKFLKEQVGLLHLEER